MMADMIGDMKTTEAMMADIINMMAGIMNTIWGQQL